MSMIVDPYKFVSGGSGGGGISFVGGATGFQSTNSGSLSLSGLSIEDDDFAVLVISRTSAVPLPTGWTEVYRANGSDPTAGVSYGICIATKFMTAGESSISFTSHSNTAYAVQIFRGVDTSSPLDVATQIQTFVNDTPRPNPPSITPVTAGAMVVACGGSHGAFDANDFTSSDLTNFLSQQNEDASFDPLVGIGYIADWESGAVDPAQFGGGATANPTWCSAASATIALRPA